MDDKRKLIERFNNLHQELIDLVSKVPIKDREIVVFDKWSLKDVLIHITAWNENDISRFNTIMEDGDPVVTWIDDLDKFNEEVVTQTRSLPWETVFNNFVESGNNLVEVARQFPSQKWSVTVDPKKEMSIEDDFGYSIEHYEKEHIPQIKSFLNLK